MKKAKMTLAVILLAMLAATISQAEVRDRRNRDFTVTATTTASTMAGGYLPGRIYYLVINESDSYDVRLATFPILVGNLGSNSRGIPLPKNYGSWEDQYNIYQSSYYVIISSQGAPATAAALTATITYKERD